MTENEALNNLRKMIDEESKKTFCEYQKAELEVFNEYERQRKIWLAGRFNALDWVTSVMETEMRKVK